MLRDMFGYLHVMATLILDNGASTIKAGLSNRNDDPR